MDIFSEVPDGILAHKGIYKAMTDPEKGVKKAQNLPARLAIKLFIK